MDSMVLAVFSNLNDSMLLHWVRNAFDRLHPCVFRDAGVRGEINKEQWAKFMLFIKTAAHCNLPQK